MRNLGRTHKRMIWMRGVVWALALIMVAPPALLAHTLRSPMPPGQPIVTNPTALQPIAPPMVPCPISQPERREVYRSVIAESATQEQKPSRDLQAHPHSGIEKTGVGEQALSQGSSASPGPTGMEKAPRQVQSFKRAEQDTLGDPISQISARLLGPPQPERISRISIEEGFAQLLTLGGLTGELRQFGYDFYNLQLPGFPPVMDVPVGPDYVLGPNDTLALYVWNVPDPNLNRSYISPVQRDGTVFIPHLGSISVTGATFSEATRLIKARMKKLLKRFDMHLSMARIRTIKIYVVGEVVRPGAYEVSSLATVSHALYAACGPMKSGSLRNMRVVRHGRMVSELDFYRFLLYGDRSHDIRLRSGDTVLVPPIGPVAAIGGPVKRPAIYELKSRTTLTDLIELAGGLMPSASRTRYQIFRTEIGRKRVILDIELGSILAAKSSKNGPTSISRKASVTQPLIQDGDFVRIASVPMQFENSVSLVGAVRDPGPYQFRPGMRVRDLLTRDQMLADSYWDRAEIIRTDPILYETTIIPFRPRDVFKGSQEGNLELRRLDKVVVSTQIKPPRVLTVRGEVPRPGTYVLEKGERLSAVLKRAGGLTPRAFPKGIIFIRESVRRSQQSEVEKFVSSQKQKLIAEAASLGAGGAGAVGQAPGQEQTILQIQLQTLDQFAERIQPGRIVVKMESIEQLEGTPGDLLLEGGDQITIPEQPQTVSIVGAVRSPVAVLHKDGAIIDDYITEAGGLASYADEKEIFILRADGSTDTSYVKLKAIEPGDAIVVPTSVEPKVRPLAFWQSIATIFAGLVSVATAAAALVVLGGQ